MSLIKHAHVEQAGQAALLALFAGHRNAGHTHHHCQLIRVAAKLTEICTTALPALSFMESKVSAGFQL